MSLNIKDIIVTPKKKRDVIKVTREELQPFFHGVSGDQSIFKCPFCVERGHKGDGYKLYVDEVKGKGWCFTCQLIVIFDEVYDLKTEVDKFVKKDFTPTEVDKILDVMSWTSPASECDVTIDYLKGRKVSYNHIAADRYNLRFAEIGGTPVLVIPNELQTKIATNCFQIKVLDESKAFSKYVTFGTVPLMWLDLTLKLTDTLILVEGVFDAMAVTGVPLLGKTISSRQQKQLREVCIATSGIEQIVIALDGEVKAKDKLNLAKLVQSVSNEIPVAIAHLPDELDPEEVVADGKIKEIFENLDILK